jgi:hypothetical protein
MAPGTGNLCGPDEIARMDASLRAALVPVSRRELPRVQAMSIAQRKAWAAAKVARRESAKRSRKARRKSRS